MGLLLKGLHWGKIRGVIRITGAKAKREFGFSTKPGAEGVMFRVYNYTTPGGMQKTGVFINNYIKKTEYYTPAQNVNRRDRFGVLSKAIYQNRSPLCYLWQKLAEEKHYYRARWSAEFIGVNMLRVGTPPDFSKMLISDGKLEPTPQITGISYIPGTNEIVINFDPAIYQNGDPDDMVYGAVFIHSEKRLEFPQPTQIWYRKDGVFHGDTLQPYSVPDLTAFVFFSNECNYSPSVSLHG